MVHVTVLDDTSGIEVPGGIYLPGPLPGMYVDRFAPSTATSFPFPSDFKTSGVWIVKDGNAHQTAELTPDQEALIAPGIMVLFVLGLFFARITA